MLSWSRHRRHLSWIAALAILLAALAPWISQARGSAGFAQLMSDWPAWQAICSATAATDPAKDMPGTGGADHGAHCPFCLPHPGDLGLPLAALPAPVLPDAAMAGLPQRFLQAPATAHAWRSSQPRAPPAAA